MFVFPMTIAPAPRRRRTTVASSLGTNPVRPFVPPVVTMPEVSSESLIVTGTP